MGRTIYLWRYGTPPYTYVWSETSPNPNAIIIDQISSDFPTIDNGMPSIAAVSYSTTRSYRGFGNADNPFVAIPNATNIFDTLISANEVGADGKLELFYGEYWTDNNVQEGDYIEFAIVDKMDVLGLFSTYGLNVQNGDILELAKYVKKRSILPNEYQMVDPRAVSVLVQGLYFRTIVYCANTGVNRSIKIFLGTAR